MERLQLKADTVVEENKQLKAEVFSLRNELEMQKGITNNLEQYTRRDCFEIAGIPEREGEDTNDLVVKVGQLAGIKIDRKDISVSHRLPKPKVTYSATSQMHSNPINSTARIIVKFVRRDTRDELYKARDELYKARTKLKNTSTRDLSLSRHSDNKIYIMESLSPSNKELLKQCLKLKYELNYRFMDLLWSYLSSKRS